MQEDMKLKIEDYHSGWEAAFRRLNEEWIAKYFKVEEADLRVFQDPETHIIAPGGAILVAILNKEAVGTVALYKRASDVFELGKMAVTPKVQGQHIGKRLMEAALERAQSLGARKIYLETNSKLGPAIGLYRSFGFVTASDHISSQYNRVDMIMELHLDS